MTAIYVLLAFPFSPVVPPSPQGNESRPPSYAELLPFLTLSLDSSPPFAFSQGDRQNFDSFPGLPPGSFRPPAHVFLVPPPTLFLQVWRTLVPFRFAFLPPFSCAFVCHRFTSFPVSFRFLAPRKPSPPPPAFQSVLARCRPGNARCFFPPMPLEQRLGRQTVYLSVLSSDLLIRGP